MLRKRINFEIVNFETVETLVIKNEQKLIKKKTFRKRSFSKKFKGHIKLRNASLGYILNIPETK